MSIQSILSKYNDYLTTGEDELARTIVYYPTSLLSLNVAIGDIRGIRGGRIVQLIADAGTGKTSLALDIVANAQKSNHACAMLDAERTYDPVYGAALGIDNSNFSIIKAPYAETGLEIVEYLIRDAGIKVVVIDSIPACLPKSEEEKDMNANEKMAASAGLWTRFCKRIVGPLADNDALLILINQWRSNLSPMARTDKKAYGAKQIEYSSGLTLQLQRVKTEQDNYRVSITVSKNKQGPLGNKTDVTLTHGIGFRADIDLIEVAVEHGIVDKSGAWFYFDNKTYKGQGIENACKNLPLDTIRAALIEKLTKE